MRTGRAQQEGPVVILPRVAEVSRLYLFSNPPVQAFALVPPWRSPPNPGRVTVELHAGGGFGPRRGGLLNDHRAGLSHHHRIHTLPHNNNTLRLQVSADRRTGTLRRLRFPRRTRRTRTNVSNVHGRRPTFPTWRHSVPGLAWSPVAPGRFHGGERRCETAATFATWHFLDGLRRV